VRSLMLEVGNGHGPIVRNKANYPKRATEAASRLRIVDWDCGSYIDLRRDASCGLAPRACAGRLYKQPDWPEPRMQNEPNSRRAAWDEAPGARDAGQSCKTNPIPPERPGRDAGGREARPGTNGAKRTQLPGAGHRGGVGESAGGWNTHYSSILSFHHSIPMLIVPNKPNSRRRRVGRGLENEGRMCETKPIQPQLHLPPEWNGAKQTQFGPAGRQAEVSAEGKHAKQSQ
jgi:hypothetical protein